MGDHFELVSLPVLAVLILVLCIIGYAWLGLYIYLVVFLVSQSLVVLHRLGLTVHTLKGVDSKYGNFSLLRVGKRPLAVGGAGD